MIQSFHSILRRLDFDYEYSKNGDFSSDLLKSAGKQMRTVWDISNNKTKEELLYGKHPTQKPLKILKRMILLSSKKGDIMLTPFAGAGSECVAAKETGRQYIGYETDSVYVDIANTRLEHAICDTAPLLETDKGEDPEKKPVLEPILSDDPPTKGKDTGSYQQLSFTLEPITKEG